MPCPFFFPLQPLVETEWSRPPRAPLGQLFAGECHASQPPAAADHALCNFGYARRECARFPAEAPFDAVRFARQGDAVLYVFEKDHAPAEHGFVNEPGEHPLLAAQARAFTGDRLDIQTRS